MTFKAGFATVLMASGVLMAQDPAPPTIRVNTRLIQVSVVVHDKKGQPVRGLTKEDFTLRERGREQQITLFTADSALSNEDAPQITPLDLGPDRYSNRAFSGQTHVSVILFDRFNTTFADQAFGRGQLLRVTRQVQHGDRVAIYVLDKNGVRVLHDFTDNADHLAKAVEDLTTQSKGLDAVGTPGDFTRDRNFTPKVFQEIAHHLSTIAGRKNLMWISGSFPLRPESEETTLIALPDEWRTYEEELTRAARALTAANIAVYPVDARGLVTDPLFAASNSIPVYTAPQNAAAAAATAAQLSRLFTPPGHEAMLLLAEGTGGRAFFNRNDVDGAIKAAIDDARVTYTLGFYSPEKDWDGKFHKIKVSVRRPGLEVRSRAGFLAVSNPAPSATDLKAEVANGLGSTLEATAIGLDARLRPDATAGSKLSLALHVSGEDLQFIEQSNGWTGSLRFAFAQFAADGRRLSESEQPLDLKIPKPAYEAAIRNGFNLTKTIEPQAGAEILKIVVVDSLTGRVGSLRIPISSKTLR